LLVAIRATRGDLKRLVSFRQSFGSSRRTSFHVHVDIGGLQRRFAEEFSKRIAQPSRIRKEHWTYETLADWEIRASGFAPPQGWRSKELPSFLAEPVLGFPHPHG